ncbi:bifunctional UDP-N-acetylglucosamine diphosphorylase/glucosamine-1-phosphate N-acetyltransferase GlmU [Nitrosomonas sp.]|uniref:bifunctional UDP-N-acetylglucosamine diphosphorylase/glucosamine-1-phosphate N-acetyltransferase GlmU n=1 Tax=Nitrosomonas sp. TaxID=42353 RepID=UPI0026011073|nr:bifunctional UDP-N-acetylglucosamine diphosphorylase/glucosamine-1-phosphate N-acetyltransferase GlmU [Nitrosomonas sp.]
MLLVNVVILAAGMGKRMRSSLPKVLHPLAGKPILLHVLDTARTLSPAKICVIYGHGGEQVRQTIGNHSDLIWIEQAQQLGTGHAVKQALPHLDSNGVTLVLFGDVPLVKRNTLKVLIEKAHKDSLVLLTVELDNPAGYGRIVRDSATNRIRAIVEEKDASPSQKKIREINTGIMILPNNHLEEWLDKLSNANTQGEYYLTDIVAMAVNAGIPIETSCPESDWEVIGVNNKIQLSVLERAYQRDIANGLMEQGVMFADPARFDVRGQLVCGNDVEIDINCVFEGSVHLGNNVKIHANCVLRNVKISDGAVIHPFSLIEDAEIGRNCRIGPYARIRPGTQLDDGVHVGNFVEIKNSHIAAESKVNHLSYIGDTEMGRKVNVGAGTITCNYDGAFKHRTIIEDDVFIGSDTQLVAPVTITKGSTVGAGSTITRDTPEGQLTLSRTRQISISNWKRPKKDKG